MRGQIGSQNGTTIHWSVPTSLQDPAINLYTSVVDFIYFRRLVESPLQTGQERRCGCGAGWGRWEYGEVIFPAEVGVTPGVGGG